MAKLIEVVEVYDPAVRTKRPVTLELTGPELVLTAIEKADLAEIIANAIFGCTGKQCIVEGTVTLKDRDGRRRRR